MTIRPLLPDRLTARPETDEHPGSRVVCPLCHTPTSMMANALAAGGEWDCTRCGQNWNAGRLAAVSAYAVWEVEHDRLVGEARVAAQAVSGASPDAFAGPRAS